jgi:hypothetical protein
MYKRKKYASSLYEEQSKIVLYKTNQLYIQIKETLKGLVWFH